MNANTEYVISAELNKARRRFPSNRLMLAALVEEVGELSKALIDHSFNKGSAQEVYNEAVQVAAMAIRVMEEGDPQFPYQYSEDLYRNFPIVPAHLDTEVVTK